MMESLRNFLTGPRLTIVIAACALPFVFLGTSSLGTNPVNSLGSVNGENISQADAQVATNIVLQRFSRIYGDDFDFNELDPETQQDLIKQELISQKVLLSKARSLGFINADTERQAKKTIIRNPAFHLDGNFNENIYEAQINSNGHTKESYIELMSNMIASEIYRSSLASSGFTTRTEVQDLAQILEQTVDVDFIRVDADLLKKQIENSQEEILSFYNNNQILFFSDEKRSFKYIALNPNDYIELVNMPTNYVEEAYEEYISNAKEDGEIRFSHIMVDKNKYDSSKSAFTIINEVMLKLREGNSFVEMTKLYSDDIVTKDTGGDLEYFDAEIFPEEFANAIKDLNENEISNIVELDDTLHILKVTEINKVEVMSINEMREVITQELINSESLALMNDDYNLIDEMVLSGKTIEDISMSLSKNIQINQEVTQSNFVFEYNDSKIKDYLFSPESKINSPNVFNSGDSVIVLEISDIIEPSLQNLETVKETVNEYLLDQKTNEKLNLLMSELALAKEVDGLDSFIDTYNFISEDSYIAVKRNSSVLPGKVISEIFKILPGESISIDATNGDKYFVDLISFNQPSQDIVEELYEQYENFSKQLISKNMTDIINEEIFNNARVNLDNLIF